MFIENPHVGDRTRLEDWRSMYAAMAENHLLVKK